LAWLIYFNEKVPKGIRPPSEYTDDRIEEIRDEIENPAIE
jgi:hypothetical protein